MSSAETRQGLPRRPAWDAGVVRVRRPRQSGMSLNVNGYPDESLLSDANVFARLEPLVDPLTSALHEKSLNAVSYTHLRAHET